MVPAQSEVNGGDRCCWTPKCVVQEGYCTYRDPNVMGSCQNIRDETTCNAISAPANNQCRWNPPVYPTQPCVDQTTGQWQNACTDTNGGARGDTLSYYDITDLTYFGDYYYYEYVQRESSCSLYTQYPERCGQFDDEDFIAADMCCACGGGEMLDVSIYLGEHCGRTPPPPSPPPPAPYPPDYGCESLQQDGAPCGPDHGDAACRNCCGGIGICGDGADFCEDVLSGPMQVAAIVAEAEEWGYPVASSRITDQLDEVITDLNVDGWGVEATVDDRAPAQISALNAFFGLDPKPNKQYSFKLVRFPSHP